MEYDETALVSFPPDGLRAAFLYARMIDNLAQSVEEIVSGARPMWDLRKAFCDSQSAFAPHLALRPRCTASISTC